MYLALEKKWYSVDRGDKEAADQGDREEFSKSPPAELPLFFPAGNELRKNISLQYSFFESGSQRASNNLKIKIFT